MDKEIDESQNLENIDNSNVGSETSPKDNSQENDKDDETYKKRYQDSSRANTHNAKVRQAYRQALKDEGASLLDIDEKIAKEAFQELVEDGLSEVDSWEEFVNQTSEDSKIDKKKLASDIRKQVKEELLTEESNKILKKALSKFDKETRELYKEEFEEISSGKKLTPKFTEREINKIIYYHNKDKDQSIKNDEALSNMASNSLGGAKKSSGGNWTKEKLRAYGVPEKDHKLYLNK